MAMGPATAAAKGPGAGPGAVPGAGPAMRRIHVGNALTAFGLGFTVPYLYVYTAQVRGLGASAAGLVVALLAVAALVVLPFVGRAIVARGAKPVLIGSAVVSAVGTLGMLSPGAAGLLVGVALLGAGTAAMQPALATLVVDCTTGADRSRAFALQFFVQNLGLGIGGLLGGHLVDETRPASFTLLYLVQAAMFLVLVAVTATLRMPGTAKVDPAQAGSSGRNGGGSGGGGSTGGGWRELLADRAMVSLCVLAFVLFFACYGQFESGLSAYGVEAAGISTSTLGTGLAANTLMIVVAQFVVLKFVERRRRSRVIAAVGLVWAVAWAAAGYAGLGAGSRTMATAAFISTYALFGLGEAMLSPTVAPLVADLAPTGLVGQYNSAFALVKQLALAIGPAVGGPMAASLHAPYIVVMLMFCLGVTALALRMERRLTAAQNQPSAARSKVVARGGAEVPESRSPAESALGESSLGAPSLAELSLGELASGGPSPVGSVSVGPVSVGPVSVGPVSGESSRGEPMDIGSALGEPSHGKSASIASASGGPVLAGASAPVVADVEVRVPDPA